MAVAKVKVEGLEALRRKLRAIPIEMKRELQTGLEKSGSEMVDMARALAPVDDGDLRDSIVMTKPGELTPIYGGGGQRKVGELQVRVTAGDYLTRYAAIVEHGRKGIRAMAARPFFWPAYRILRKRFKRRAALFANRALMRAIR